MRRKQVLELIGTWSYMLALWLGIFYGFRWIASGDNEKKDAVELRQAEALERIAESLEDRALLW